ncbi:TRAP transporter small permease [Amaricoccus tamworthensis]|uniref:TRAP transporter small permease n=1 Tax=Amaricoccus tamworthensis TaxID=57002 RepID=UPI003C797821
MDSNGFAGEGNRFDRFLDLLAKVCRIITGVSLVFLTVIFGWLVYGRYVLNSTPTWVEQVSLLLIVLITFLGAAVGIHENTHLGVSYFRELSPKPVRIICAVITNLALGGFGLVLLWTGFQLTMFKWSTEIPLIHLPEGLRAVPITICGGLMLLFCIGHLLRMARGIEDEMDLVE